MSSWLDNFLLEEILKIHSKYIKASSKEMFNFLEASKIEEQRS